MTDLVSMSMIQELRGAGLVIPTFNARAVSEGLLRVRRAVFPAPDLTIARLSAFGELELAEQVPGQCSVLLRPEPSMLISLLSSRGHCEIAVAGVDQEAVSHVLDDIVATLRDPETELDRIPVTFWAQTNGSPMCPRRRILAPSWGEIASNYPRSMHDPVGELMAATEPGPGGLVLWHGDPGTGKSHALRALAREWHDWCEMHFITDADAFLGGHTGYLLDTLLRSPQGTPNRDRRWRLIVLEDAGELLAADARAVAGQGLSRLLNLSDGLLGAGMRALVLVTTNEPLRRLHPAVVRSGRTWAEIEFPAFPADEANAWLAARQVDARVTSATPLAELFAIAAGRPVPESAPIGSRHDR